jgi:ketosteroid isomerase-like protein
VVSSTTAQDDVSAIRTIAARWAKAVEEVDIPTLASLMAEDIIVVHGNGRCVCGRDAVLADLASSFSTLRVTQDVRHEETVMAGSWAFDRARVETTVVRQQSGDAQHVVSHAWTILRKDASRGWVVARVIGVVDRTAAGE